MNSFRLVIKRINVSIINNLLIYITFISFYVFCVIVTIYVSGKYFGVISAINDYDETLSSFSVDFKLTSETKLSDVIDQLKNYTSDENVEYVRIRFLDAEWSEKQIVAHYVICFAKNEKDMISDYLLRAGLNNIDIDEFIKSDDEAIIINDNTNSDHNDIFIIQGSDYSVVSEIPRNKNGMMYHLVSYYSAVCNNPIIREIKIKYNSISSYAQLTKIKSRLANDFFNGVIYEPIQRDYSMESVLSIDNILVYLIVVLSSINFAYIYYYILERKKRDNTIYYLCGCSKIKIFVLNLIEILSFSFLCTILGILLFHFAIKPIIIMLEPLLRYNFYFELYLIVSFLSISLGTIILILTWLIQQRSRK